MYIYTYKNLASSLKGDPKTPFSIATTPICWRGRYSIPWIAPLYLWFWPYNPEYWARQCQVPFLTLWYDSTWDWTPVSQTTDEHYSLCYILTLDQAVSQRDTCVNKRKNITWSNRKWALWKNICRCMWQLSQLGTVKARVKANLKSVRAPRYELLPPVERPPAAESWKQWRREWEPVAVSENVYLGTVALSGLRLSNPSRDVEEVLSGSWR